MKFLGVSGVFDYAGLSRCSRYRACSCCLPHITRASASGLTVYGAEYPPRLSSVYPSLSTSRYPAQDSRPSGSLLLSRKELSSSASCRFNPAHCNRLIYIRGCQEHFSPSAGGAGLFRDIQPLSPWKTLVWCPAPGLFHLSSCIFFSSDDADQFRNESSRAVVRCQPRIYLRLLA